MDEVQLKYVAILKSQKYEELPEDEKDLFRACLGCALVEAAIDYFKGRSDHGHS